MAKPIDHATPGSPYWCWKAMKARCRLLPTHRNYRYYNGKGIYVVDEWQTYEAFRDWALSNGWQSGLTIDRLDPAGPYAPWNCRLISFSENSSRSKGALWVAFGEAKPIYQWLVDPRCVVSRYALSKRLAGGWDVEEALTTPPRRGQRRKH